MSDLVLEFYSEEIPARMQVKAVQELNQRFSSQLKEEGLSFKYLDSFSTPRRLSLIVSGLAEHSVSFFEERRGPRVGSPSVALEGFARSVNADVSSLYTKKEKKGEFYFYRLEHSGYPAQELIKKISLKIAHNFPWQKSMRWGEGSFRWVRPLRSILCTLFRESQKPEVIEFELNGVFSCNYTFGHRSMFPEKFYPKSAEDYVSGLREKKVILDQKDREKIIWESAEKLLKGCNANIVSDDALLSEVAGLVEWPVVLMGEIDKEFLTLPREILQVSMREHQKFFSITNNNSGLIYKFIVVGNIDAKDNGKSVLNGNSRVLRSRLRDAKFFFQNDLSEIKNATFAGLNHRLEAVTFHNKIGNQSYRVLEMRKISAMVAKLLQVDSQTCDQATNLCKTDLTTQVVSEFPELQGVMGRIYCEVEGQDESICNAVSDHYKPLTHNDEVPQEMVSAVVAIADRIFTLTSFWAIEEKPSGSKDPFALRRCAIGLIRILVEKRLDINLSDLLKKNLSSEISEDLCQFLAERFKVYLIEKGYAHDTIQACLTLVSFSNPYNLFIRVEQLEQFRKTDSFLSLIDAYRRPNNILVSEENKSSRKYELEPSVKLFSTNHESKLMGQLVSIEQLVKASLSNNDYLAAFQALADLNDVVEEFFENVVINSEIPLEKENRLHLCNKVRTIMHSVAKFSELTVS